MVKNTIKSAQKNSADYTLKVVGKKILLTMEEDPFKITETEGGIIIPDAAYSDKSGKMESQKPMMFYGTVVEVGDEVGSVKKGDAVYFQPYAGHPIFFGNTEYVVMNELDILTFITSNE